MLFGVFLFFNMLKNNPFCIDGTYFLFLLSRILQIFITKYVFCCHQENSTILSGLKIIHLGKISLIPLVSHLRHHTGYVCKRSLKFLCNNRVDGLIHFSICGYHHVLGALHRADTTKDTILAHRH